MAKKRKPLSQEKKTELAKAIAENSQRIAKTYASIENSLSKFFRWVSTWIDKILFNQKYSKIVSLVLAIVLFLTVNMGGDNLKLFSNDTKTAWEVGNLPITTVVNDEVYEVIGLPETVNVKVLGDASDIQYVKSQSTIQLIQANLEGLTEGTHTIKLSPVNFGNRLDVILEPSSVQVTIRKKGAKKFTASYEFINLDKMDPIYSLETPELDPTEITVKASKKTLSEIAYVKALVDVSDVTGDYEKKAPLVAYNAQGEKVDVSIYPETVNVKGKVSTPSKDIPIVVEIVGDIEKNLAVESYTLDHQALTIYAPNDVLSKINEIKVQIPANNISENNTHFNMPINLPSGVRKKSVSNVNIDLVLAKKEKKELKEIPILWKNKPDGFNVAREDESQEVYAVVEVSGAKTVLETITADQLEVYFDLSNVTEAGTYEFELKVDGYNKLASYKLKNAKIKIKITKVEG